MGEFLQILNWFERLRICFEMLLLSRFWIVEEDKKKSCIFCTLYQEMTFLIVLCRLLELEIKQEKCNIVVYENIF